MKNLTKRTLISLIIFSTIAFLLFTVSAAKVTAQTDLPACGDGLNCYNLGDSGEACHESNPNKCVTGTNLDQYKCCDGTGYAFVGGICKLVTFVNNNNPTCIVTPTATPIATPTLAPIPTSTPVPSVLKWVPIVFCPVPTPTSTATPTQTQPNRTASTPTPTPPVASACTKPSDCNNPSPQCQQANNATCNNGICVYPAKDRGTRCSDTNGYPGVCIAGSCDTTAKSCNNLKQDGNQYNCQSDPCTGETEVGNKIVCSVGQYCCKAPLPTATPTLTLTPTSTTRPTNTPVPTATLTPTKAPTPTPFNNVSLALSLNAQDMPEAATSNLDVELALYNYATGTLEPGIDKRAFFARTSIEEKKYSITTPPANLNKAKYYIFARKGNMIARSVFNVSKPNETVSVPTATLVLGDIDKDDIISSSDYNALWNCWNKSITESNSICELSDLNNDKEINEIDFNTLMKGWAIWKEEGKGL